MPFILKEFAFILKRATQFVKRKHKHISKNLDIDAKECKTVSHKSHAALDTENTTQI